MTPFEPTSGLPAAQTLRRGMSILRLLARAQPGGMGISDISRRLGLSKPTTVRLAHALAEEAFIVQAAGTRRYCLGPAAFVIGIAAEPSYLIQRVAAPVVRALALETGDSACFSVRLDMEVVCLSAENGIARLPESTLRAGDRYPLGVGSAGLAVLSALSDVEIDHVLENYRSRIERTFPEFSISVIRRLVDESRLHGYSMVRGLLLQGYWALGVPLVQSDGQPIAAITVVSSEARMGPVRCAVLGERMRRISCDLMSQIELRGRESHLPIMKDPAFRPVQS